MFLRKSTLSRRTLLRGAGSAIALPLLDAMLPAQTRTAPAPPRLVCIEMVHGAAGSTPEGAAKHYWSPAASDGVDFDFSFTLKPLEPLREYITIVTNTDARTAEASAPAEVGADHFRSSAVFLTGARAKQTEGSDVANGASIDQLYAAGQPSLQLCIETPGSPGSCGFSYNCVYANTISWASEAEPLPMTLNPRTVFTQLFGRTASGSVSAE